MAEGTHRPDQNLRRTGLAANFSRDLDAVLASAEIIVPCTGHKLYRDRRDAMLGAATQAIGVFDACNLWSAPAVQAQDFSQACSISMPFFNRPSQTEVPGGTSMTAPSGHSSMCGRTMIWVIV